MFHARRSFISLFLALFLLISMLPVTALAVDSSKFADVNPSDWYYDAVQYVSEQDLMKGTSNTAFSPNVSTSRGMLITILYRLTGNPDIAADCPFSDVARGSYYEDAITWGAQEEIITGYRSGTFGPDDPITREQLAVIFYRYARYLGMDAVTTAENLTGFADDDTVSEYAVAALNWAVGAGLINGVGNGLLKPQGNAVRAQVAAMLQRFCENIAPGYGVHTVTFALNYSGAGTYKTVKVLDGACVSAPVDPSRSGYQFNGWYTRASGGSKFDFDTTITGDLTLYAQWSKTGSSGSSGSDGHNYVGEVTTPATCTEDGEMTYTCSGCGDTYTRPIPALGHDYGDYRWDGTYQASSTHSRICSRCGNVERESCQFTDTVETIDSDTVTKHTCSVCGYSYTTTTSSTAVAMVGGQLHETLSDAITAAAGGVDKVITLVNDAALSAQLNLPDGVTLDGGGHSLSVAGSVETWPTENGSKHLLATGSNTVIRNLVLNCKDKAYGMVAYQDQTVRLEQVSILDSAGIGLTVNGSTVTAVDLNIYGSQVGSVNVDGDGAQFTLESGKLEDALQIWSELEALTAVTAPASFHAYGAAGFYTWAEADAAQVLQQLSTVPPQLTELTMLTDQTVEGDLAVPEGITLIVPDGVQLRATGDISGTIKDENGATLIYSATQLRALADTINAEETKNTYRNATVRLMDDIDLSGENWTPISGNGGNMNGLTLDGEGHTISGMTVVGTGSLGFIGSNASSFTIRDLTFDGASVNGSGSFIGTVIGYQYGHVTLTNVDVTNSRVETSIANKGIRIGGLVGFSVLHDGAKLYLTDCDVSHTTLTGYHNTCGLVGTLINLYESEDANTWSMNNCSVTDCTFNIGTTTEKHVGVFTVDGGSYPDRETNDKYFETVNDTTITTANRQSGNTFAYNLFSSAKLEAANSEQLASFTAKENASISIGAGNYELPSTIADGVTVTGGGSSSVIDAAQPKTISASNFTLDNVKVDGGSGHDSTLILTGSGTTISNATFINGGQDTWNAHVEVRADDGITTIAHCNMSGSMRGILIHNEYGQSDGLTVTDCVLDATYPINVNGNNPNFVMSVTDTTLKGWLSFAAIKSASFTDCTFGVSTSGYSHLRPYSSTTLTRCDFSEGFTFDCGVESGVTIEFINCTVNGQPMTAAMLKDILSADGASNVTTNTWIVDGTTVVFS